MLKILDFRLILYYFYKLKKRRSTIRPMIKQAFQGIIKGRTNIRSARLNQSSFYHSRAKIKSS